MIDDIALLAETIDDLLYALKSVLLLKIGLFCMTKGGQEIPSLL